MILKENVFGLFQNHTLYEVNPKNITYISLSFQIIHTRKEEASFKLV